MASEVDVEALEREARAVIDERGLGGLMVPCATVLGLVEALRVARERESYALAAIERNDEVHAEALRAVRQRAERAEQTRDAHAEALARAAREAGDAADRIAALTMERDDARSLLAHAERAIEQGTGDCLLVDHLKRALMERDEARAALIRSQEDHRAAVEALETYEERIGDIADHVLGLVPPDVPSIVKLDAIERRCGEERVAARQAERERDEARAALARARACAHETCIRVGIVGHRWCVACGAVVQLAHGQKPADYGPTSPFGDWTKPESSR